VASPLGGEMFSVGDTIAVQWFADTLYAPGIVVQFSVDEGETWHMLTEETIPNTTGQGVFRWVVPPSLRGQSTASTTCLIRVKDYSAPFYDLSDAFFTITASVGAAAAPHVQCPPTPVRLQHTTGYTVVRVAHTGAHQVRLYSLSGALLWEASGDRSADYRVPSMHQTGILQLTTGTTRLNLRSTSW
jgi:hypothetical protein